MAEARRQLVHQFWREDDLIHVRRIDPCELLLEASLVDRADTDEGTSERHALSHGRVECLRKPLLRNGA
jgi:hypothetical protein